MTLLSLIASCTLATFASLLVFAHTANLEPDEPSYPRGTEHRARLQLAILACLLSFAAGAVL